MTASPASFAVALLALLAVTASLMVMLATPATAAAAVVAGTTAAEAPNTPEVLDGFQRWAQRHNRVYTAAEHGAAYKRWRATAGRVAHINTHMGWTAELNHFSDMTETELSSYLGYGPSDNTTVSKRDGNPEVAFNIAPLKTGQILQSTYDWRDYGAVASVKDQASCGSCWAFSTVAAIEGSLGVYGRNPDTPWLARPMVDLSAQQLVDCLGYNGCNGGWQNEALSNVISSHGGQMATLSSYPYTGSYTGSCQVNDGSVAPKQAGGTISYFVTPRGYDQIMLAIAVAPLSSVICATNDMFSYRSGIFASSNCNQGINHAVAFIGWGLDLNGPTNYWIAKNQWGTGWGMQGYFNIVRGVNMCQTEEFAYFACIGDCPTVINQATYVYWAPAPTVKPRPIGPISKPVAAMSEEEKAAATNSNNNADSGSGSSGLSGAGLVAAVGAPITAAAFAVVLAVAVAALVVAARASRRVELMAAADRLDQTPEMSA